MHIENFRHKDLYIETLETSPKDLWCIFGENNSGIDRFVDLLSGKIKDFSADILDLPSDPAILSFQAQQELFEQELRNDDSDFLDKMDPGTLVCEFIPDFQAHLPLLKAFDMDRCLQKGYRQLSSGQSRKLLFLQKITNGATSLAIQNPYDGLDEKSCHEFNHALQKLPDRNIELLLFVNNITDIPTWCTHLAWVKSGRLEQSGKKEHIQPLLEKPADSHRISINPITASNTQKTSLTPEEKDELIYLEDGFAGYGDKTLFTGLNLKISAGDHTLITGPNGCGKSTFLDIITGDNPKCYANKLRIFGNKRGSGESIWEIKQRMGIVSPALHRDHRIPGSALHVVLSGLFDTIGLYQKVSSTEIKIAEQWLAWLALKDKSNTGFRRLTFAEQRLVLIGRALIKRPKLLILDEATQGLDDVNRYRLLDLLEEIAARKLSTILFVSHRKDEQRAIFSQQIQLDAYAPQC